MFDNLVGAQKLNVPSQSYKNDTTNLVEATKVRTNGTKCIAF